MLSVNGLYKNRRLKTEVYIWTNNVKVRSRIVMYFFIGNLSNAFSVRNQGVGCALAWVTIARDSESDYPFKSCGAISQDLCRTLRCPIGSTLTKLSLSFSSGCYCTVRLLTHVLCKPTHFLFHSFIATMSYCLQTSFISVRKGRADKHHVWGTPMRSSSRSNSR